ncbi:MAG: transglutaminase-like domain-containing protein [Pirellulales bacterium]
MSPCMPFRLSSLDRLLSHWAILSFARWAAATIIATIAAASTITAAAQPPAATPPAAQPTDSSPALTLDPQLPYQAERRSPVTYDVDFSVVVTPPYQTKRLQVWIPSPPSDAGQEVSGSEWSSFPTFVEPRLGVEPKFGNRFAYFEFVNPQGALILRHRFRIQVWELRWNIEPSKVATVERWPSAFDAYRMSESQGVVVDERVRRLLGEVVGKPSNPLHGMTSIMHWADSNLTYDHVDASLAASSIHALEKRRGHCSDYHGLCASLGRALGYPTRITYGINPFPKNSPSHCKLEAYLPPYGWVSFDVSETQKLAALVGKQEGLSEDERRRLREAAYARLAGGFRDNTWYLQTRGSDFDLAPPASRRAAVVRTAYVEADGIPLADPDPANKKQTAHAWMTVHSYRPNRVVAYPFTDLQSLDIAR